MLRFLLQVLILALSSLMAAQDATVRGTVNVLHHASNASGSADVIIWLTPSGPAGAVTPSAMVRLVQKDKRFTPHVLAVTVGTQIEFPNQDPFFHDVFSIYRGKPFDLGLYESGTARKIQFSQPGVSYIFCNIHPQMNAVVVVLKTAHFAITGKDGSLRIGHLTPGQYKLEAWYEFASDSELAALSRDIEITPGENTLGTITVHSSDAPKDHLNKYGETYSPGETEKY